MARLSLAHRIAKLSEEIYRREAGDLLGEVEELAVAVLRRKTKKKELATQAVRVIKQAMVKALMEGDERAFYQLSKIKGKLERFSRTAPVW